MAHESNTGTYAISDLLAARFTTAKTYGLNIIADILRADLAAHNALVSSMLSDLCEVGTDARRMTGGVNDSYMTEVDEFGRVATQKYVGGQEVGFPLRYFQYAAGWTRKFLENATPADLATRQIDAEKAHLREIQRQIKKALLSNANYTFVDFLVDNTSIYVKRLINADNTVIAPGPNGESFDGASHNHYVASETFTAAILLDLIDNVVEHGHGSSIRMYINTAEETAIRAFTEFTPYLDPRISYGANINVANKSLDISRLDNRAIGIFGAAEVWVKSWIPANYIFVFDVGDSCKLLYFRHRSPTASNLTLAAEFDTFPLQAEYFEAEFGIGVWTRTNGALLYKGGSSWVNPTIA